MGLLKYYKNEKTTRYLHDDIDWPTLSKFITFTEEHTHVKKVSNVHVCAIHKSSITYAIGPTQTKWTSSVFYQADVLFPIYCS